MFRRYLNQIDLVFFKYYIRQLPRLRGLRFDFKQRYLQYIRQFRLAAYTSIVVGKKMNSGPQWLQEDYPPRIKGSSSTSTCSSTQSWAKMPFQNAENPVRMSAEGCVDLRSSASHTVLLEGKSRPPQDTPKSSVTWPTFALVLTSENVLIKVIDMGLQFTEIRSLFLVEQSDAYREVLKEASISQIRAYYERHVDRHERIRG